MQNGLYPEIFTQQWLGSFQLQLVSFSYVFLLSLMQEIKVYHFPTNHVLYFSSHKAIKGA